MPKLDLASLEPFDVYADANTKKVRWLEWINRFKIYVLAADIVKNSQKCNLLLHCAGKQVQAVAAEIHPHNAQAWVFEELIDSLTTAIGGKTNVAFERYDFRSLVQDDDDIDEWYAKLREKNKTCEFGDLENSLIRDQIIAECKSSRLRRHLLKEEDLDLEKALVIARTEQLALSQAEKMEKKTRSAGAYAIKAKTAKRAEPAWASAARQHHREKEAGSSAGASGTSDESVQCNTCGWYGHERCDRAKGHVCRKCGRKDHFAKACKESQEQDVKQVTAVKAVAEDSDDESKQSTDTPSSISTF